jgi:hypothetical protein
MKERAEESIIVFNNKFLLPQKITVEIINNIKSIKPEKDKDTGTSKSY